MTGIARLFGILILLILTQVQVSLGEGWYLFGINAYQHTFSVERKYENGNKNMKGTLKEPNFALGPTVGYTTGIYLFGDSNIGLIFDLTFSYFRINTQEIKRIERIEVEDEGAEKKVYIHDVGSQVEGYSMALTPEFVYNFQFSENHHFYLGLGIGYGYIISEGDIYFTDGDTSTECQESLTIDSIRNTCEKHHININQGGASVGLVIGYRIGPFAVYIRGAGPSANIGDLNDEEVDEQFSYSSIQIATSFLYLF